MSTKASMLLAELNCHKGPIQVHPGLWLGDQDEGELALQKGLARVAVPLNKMDGTVWEHWDGEIIYIPITDFSVLPRAIAERKARELADRINAGDTLSMFCFGGHGRTGYMAALVLGFLGYEDPIAHVRKRYCDKVIETRKQIDQISDILDLPGLKAHKPTYASSYGRITYEDILGYEDIIEYDIGSMRCKNCDLLYACNSDEYGVPCDLFHHVEGVEGGECE